MNLHRRPILSVRMYDCHDMSWHVMTCHDIPWTAHVSNWIHLCSRAKLLELSLPLLSVSFLSAALTALIGLLLIFTLATFALQGLRIQGSFLQDLCWDLCWNLSSWLQSLERLMSFMPATAAHAYVQALRHTHTGQDQSMAWKSLQMRRNRLLIIVDQLFIHLKFESCNPI